MKICKKGLHSYNPGVGCPECRASYYKKWMQANLGYHANWNHAHPDNVVVRNKKSHKKYREKRAVKEKQWRQTNSGRVLAKNRKYELSKLQRTPNWLTNDNIKQIERYYMAAQWIKSILNQPIEVDHIVPLQGKNVSGLHVPWNLQLLTEEENCVKGNKRCHT